MANFTSLLLHAFVVYPVAHFILLRPSSPAHTSLVGQRAVRLAQVSVFFLLCTLLDVYVNHPAAFEPNYFTLLQVSRSAPTPDIKRAFRRMSLSEHPDKNPDKDPSGFTALQQAHDVLTNEPARLAYDAFGPLGVKWVEKSENVQLNGWMGTAIEVLSQFAMTLFLTLLGAANANGRAGSYSLLAVFLYLTAMLRFQPDHELLWGALDYRFARFQLVQLLWAMYPPLVMAICTVCKAVFPDRDAQLLELAQFITLNQVEIMRRVDGDKDRAMRGNTFLGAAPPPPPPPPGFFARIPSWVYLVVFSVVFNYVTGQK